MKEQIIAFLSSRTNLTIFQCLLYLIVGYMMGQYLDWARLVIMYIVLFGIQFITRTKAVADGMMFRQLMLESKTDTNEFLKLMNDKVKEMKKDEWN